MSGKQSSCPRFSLDRPLTPGLLSSHHAAQSPSSRQHLISSCHLQHGNLIGRHPIRSRGAAAWKCQRRREVARALIRPRLFSAAASSEPAITLMSASSVSQGTRGTGRCAEKKLALTTGEHLSRFRQRIIRYAVCHWLRVASKRDSLRGSL